MSRRRVKNNPIFSDSSLCNDMTYWDYLDRLKKLCLSMFEWVNLPKSMNERYLEETLYYKGMAAMLKDSNYGYINTQAASSGNLNIYGLPTALNCYSHGYSERRVLYTGINDDTNKENDCILVMNNWGMCPTAWSIELFAYRLSEAERITDVNIKGQKTPVLITCEESQKLSLEKAYEMMEGNAPVIFANKNAGINNSITSINTNVPYLADKLMQYKKDIWNECLTFLGINNIAQEKKERLISDEANNNNELINLNLQSMFIPRQKACEEFNELFGLKGTDKEISVRLRSDLWNIIKENESVVTDYNKNGIPDELEGDNNE